MSNTIIDMPKVTQMLDAGWSVHLFKNPLGSYSAKAKHPEENVMRRTRSTLIHRMSTRTEYLAARRGTAEEVVDEDDFDERNGWLVTDDFTPEQALTRLAYKAVDGEIL